MLVLGARSAVWLDPDGEVLEPKLNELRRLIGGAAPLLVDAPSVARRLNLPADFPCYDLLSLFAFVLPAQFCAPTARGVAALLDLGRPASLEAQAVALGDAAEILLGRLVRLPVTESLVGLARTMALGGWSWGESVRHALGIAEDGARARPGEALAVWRRLPEWVETAPPPPPTQNPVDPAAARRRLARMVRTGAAGARVEERPQQGDYASAATQAFLPRDTEGAPHVVLAEAGTGVGKTLGYLAPASLWAEANGGSVWVSTYTRNLQRQIDGELARLYPDPDERRRRVVIRKGRENYLCLLNFEEAANAARSRPGDFVALGLVARWAEASEDGSFNGGDFPGWLADLLGRPLTVGLADRRGECIYSACPHYSRCFIEHGIRRARQADIVIANHALVMVQAALGGLDDATAPTRYVFDEGHHLFEAADSAFAAQFSALATADLRRWMLGAEGGSGRARGLRRRIEDLLLDDDAAQSDLQRLLIAAAGLPGEGWAQRLRDAQPHGVVEAFLMLVAHQVRARATGVDQPYDIEADRQPMIAGLAGAAAQADRLLADIELPAKRLAAYLARRLADEADELDTPERQRLEATIRSLDRRLVRTAEAWRAMLADLARPTPHEMVDWLSITRGDGRDVDVGLHRHWIDPTIPFAKAVLETAHGAVVTSATLTDGAGTDGTGTGGAGTDGTGTDGGHGIAAWEMAEARTGTAHLPMAAYRARVPSPFDYAAQTRAFVVTDVRRDDVEQVAAAYRALFLAAGGGALGLFTAIARLRAVRERLLAPLDAAGLLLLAQHGDGLDVSTLIDIFRAEENACLLGTDAVRDGVDVPGRSLRLLVFDRVPWPRPSILHRVRRERFGGANYDDRITRLRLRQAFGRLVRRADDVGVFVLLDAMMPTRLAGFLPEGVTLRRVGLAEAVAETASFLRPPPPEAG